MKACPSCNGSGWTTEMQDGMRVGISCMRCQGRTALPETRTEYRAWHRMLRMERPLQPLHPPPTLIIVTLPREESA